VSREIVMVGASAGGLDAVCALLRDLPADFRMALVVVQHRSRDSEALCEVLQDCTPLPTEEVVDKAPIDPGRVYIAPPDYHLLVERGHFSLSLDEPELYSRPSIDVSFGSAAEAYGAGVVGVVLTGANRDGARGLRLIAARGGHAIVQDPSSAEVPVMPAAALAEVPAAEVLTIPRIAARLRALQPAGAGGGRA